MDKQYDIIIIGAGIAGLVAGNGLLDKGRRVLILEQNPYPGGCASSFERKGYRFDAAVHWISQAGEGGIVRQVLTELGIEDKVQFTRLPRPASVWFPDKRISPGFGKEALVEEFSRAYPAHKEAIAGFWDDVDDTKEQLWRLIKSDPGKMGGLKKLMFNATFPLRFGKIAKYHKKKASDVIKDYFKDPELCRAIEALGIFPGISFVHYSWFNSVALDGDAYYPAGGIQAVPDALAERFMAKGGSIRYKALVENIMVEKGRAGGVRLAGGEELTAEVVISAGDARNTFLNMVGEDNLPKGFVSGLKGWRQSESFFYVYLGVDMDLKSMGFDGAPLWYLPKDIDKEAFPMLGGGAIGIGMPSVLEPSLAPAGKGIVILGMVASCAHMAGCPVRAQGEDGKSAYKAIKGRITDYMIELAGEVIPGLRENAEVVVSASPHTFERYTMNYQGASSGWSMAAEDQHKLGIRTPVRGLYMAGHWTMNPGGVPAAFVSGKMAAGEIDRHWD